MRRFINWLCFDYEVSFWARNTFRVLAILTCPVWLPFVGPSLVKEWRREKTEEFRCN